MKIRTTFHVHALDQGFVLANKAGSVAFSDADELIAQLATILGVTAHPVSEFREHPSGLRVMNGAIPMGPPEEGPGPEQPATVQITEDDIDPPEPAVTINDVTVTDPAQTVFEGNAAAFAGDMPDQTQLANLKAIIQAKYQGDPQLKDWEPVLATYCKDIDPKAAEVMYSEYVAAMRGDDD